MRLIRDGLDIVRDGQHGVKEGGVWEGAQQVDVAELGSMRVWAVDDGAKIGERP